MGFKYLVLGAGMGEAIAYNLLQQKDTSLVAIADKDAKTVLSLGRKFDKASVAHVDYLVIDIEKGIDLQAMFNNFDVVISALPARFSRMLAETAIDSKVNFCELGGVVDVTAEILKLNSMAKKAGISIVLDNGVMPGLGMIITRMLMGNVVPKSIEIIVGGLPQKPRPPINYQRMYSIEGLKHQCYDRAPVIKDGSIVWVDALSSLQTTQIPALKKFSPGGNGTVESFITSGASTMPMTLQGEGVINFCERTIRWPGFVEFVKGIPSESQFENLMMPHINTPVDDQNPDLLYMKISVEDKDNRLETYTLLDKYSYESGLTAMQRTTGIPTALMARLIARGKIKNGVYTSDIAIPYNKLGLIMPDIGKHFNGRFVGGTQHPG